jgi:sec-independent protein translocase protein TatB
MFDVGAGEMLFILVAALLLFGPKKIPEVAQMVGRGLREFRRAQDGLREQIREVTSEIDDPFSDKPVAAKTFKKSEPIAPPVVHEPEAPGQMSLLENPSESENPQGDEVLKENTPEENPMPQIRPAKNSVARPGRRSTSPPPETAQPE